MVAAEFQAQGLQQDLDEANQRIQKLEELMSKQSGNSHEIDELKKKVKDLTEQLFKRTSMVKGLELDVKQERDEKEDLQRRLTNLGQASKALESTEKNA